MNRISINVSIALLAIVFLGAVVRAEDGMVNRHVIKVKVGGGEVVVVDVSDLAVGESRSITTESGATIDVLQGPDGIELYVDGELQDLAFDRAGEHGTHGPIGEPIDIECSGKPSVDCMHELVMIAKDDPESEGELHLIKKHMEIVCASEGDCDHSVWIREDGAGHTVDPSAEAAHPEVIVLRRLKEQR